jgi:hypothetical protein
MVLSWIHFDTRLRQVWKKIPMDTRRLEEELRRIKASVKQRSINHHSKLSDMKEVVLDLSESRDVTCKPIHDLYRSQLIVEQEKLARALSKSESMQASIVKFVNRRAAIQLEDCTTNVKWLHQTFGQFSQNIGLRL